MSDRECEVYSMVGDRYTYLLTGASTDGACFMFEAHVPPGSGSPLHVHSREDEAFYVVEGEFEFHVNGATVRLTSGGFLQSRRGDTHNFKNVGPTAGKLIITVTPAGLEHFFAEVGTQLGSRDDDPVPPSADEIARLVELAPKYGLTLIH